jgi:carbamate kinase
MKLVVALGGNALLRRGQALSADNQLQNIRRAAAQLARVALVHDMVLTHGNGPQVGLLLLQSAAYKPVQPYPLDVLGAETEGMIGYQLEQELANLLPENRTVVTLLTRTEVDAKDPAFTHPTKPVGPMYTQEEAQRLALDKGWSVAADGNGFRRVVASPAPLRVLGIAPIAWLLEKGALVIAAGGGGIPVVRAHAGATASAGGHRMQGVEAVIDKDLCAGLIAQALQADCLVIATDVTAVYLDWGQPSQRAIGRTTPAALTQHTFPAGSMGPKVQAATQFVTATGKRAVIGSLDEIEALLAGTAGTQICADATPAPTESTP